MLEYRLDGVIIDFLRVVDLPTVTVSNVEPRATKRDLWAPRQSIW